MLKKILIALNPRTWYEAYKIKKQLEKKRSASEFAHKHKNLLVIILDPEDDTMFMAYHDQQVLNSIKTIDGKNHHIVRDVMKAGRFKSSIDFFLVAILEQMKAPLTIPAVQHFVKWLDGAVYSIGQRLSKIKDEDKMFPMKQEEKLPEKEMAVLKADNYK